MSCRNKNFFAHVLLIIIIGILVAFSVSEICHYIQSHYRLAQGTPKQKIEFGAILFMAQGFVLNTVLEFILYFVQPCLSKISKPFFLWVLVCNWIALTFLLDIVISCEQPGLALNVRFHPECLLMLLPMSISTTYYWLPKNGVSLLQVFVTHLMSPYLLILSLIGKGPKE